MPDLSNDDLKALLQNRITELENSSIKEEKTIDLESVSFLIKTLGLPNDFVPLAQRVFELTPRISVIWLHLAECTGCTESLLRANTPKLDELIFDYISLEYQETIMQAVGWQAEENIDKILEAKKDFLLAVEGGVSPIDTFYLTIGAHGHSGYEILEKVAKNAKAIFAIGTCSCYGGVQAANPNPIKACGIQEVLNQKVVHIPGCPPSDINIITNLCFYALFNTLPNLDEKNRPKWAYGKCLHDMCERKAKFEAGVFAQKFDDDLAKNGACLFKIGCKGPYTYNNCPKVKFNAKTSWPVQAGHGCMACSEADFWDEFGVYEEPMKNIFAYNDHSFKDYNDLNDLSLSDDKITLNLNDKLSINFKDQNGENIEFLNFEFESNVKLILSNIAKNKMGASLVEVYKKEFSQNYDFIQKNYNDTSMISSDIFKFFEYIYVLNKGQFLNNKDEFLNYAKSYKFKHISPFDIKLNLNDTGAKLDISKALRIPLIYLCGGLDLEAISFSACKVVFENLSKALNFIKQKKQKNIALNANNIQELSFIKANLVL